MFHRKLAHRGVRGDNKRQFACVERNERNLPAIGVDLPSLFGHNLASLCQDFTQFYEWTFLGHFFGGNFVNLSRVFLQNNKIAWEILASVDDSELRFQVSLSKCFNYPKLVRLINWHWAHFSCHPRKLFFYRSIALFLIRIYKIIRDKQSNKWCWEQVSA